MLFDTHTHVNLDQFDADAAAVIKQCLDEDIWMVNVGTDLAHSQKAVALAHQYDKGVYASVGLHPNEVSAGANFSIFEELAHDEKVVGIGETGLDYYRIRNKELGIRNYESEVKKLQREIFIKHIELSQRVHKPLIIHCRNAHDDVRAILNSYFKIHNSARGVMHFFTGTKDDARAYLNLGMHISFSGVITFAKEYEDLVRFVPLDRVLTETDAPFAAPVPHRGKRNEPSYVKHVAEKIAELKGLSFEEVAEATTRNARALFQV